MLEASNAIISNTGMLMMNEITVAQTRSEPGNADRAKKTPQASVAPTGAEKTALKIVASRALASRTNPVLWRTKSLLCPATHHLLATPVGRRRYGQRCGCPPGLSARSAARQVLSAT
jgi:hypothetical protein